MKFAIKFLLGTVTLSVAASAVALLALGQSSTSRRADPVQRELQRQLDREVIENALRERPARHGQRYPQPVLAQIREDFLRIQVVDRKLMRALLQSSAFDLELVTKSTAEIRKLAARLKQNLALPGSESAAASAEEIEARADSLKSSLYELSKLIDEFVSNPMFNEIRLADIQWATKARRDLEGIIKLSGEVKRNTERLRRVPRNDR